MYIFMARARGYDKIRRLLDVGKAFSAPFVLTIKGYFSVTALASKLLCDFNKLIDIVAFYGVRYNQLGTPTPIFKSIAPH